MSRRYPDKDPPLPPRFYLVIDLEATCDRPPLERDARETIEIGAVLVDAAGRELDSMQTFVRPIERPQLSRFCTDLTSITQERVDAAPLWPQAMTRLRPLMVEPDTVFCSWGRFDRRLFDRESVRHGIAHGLPPHWNLAGAFSARLGRRRKFGLLEALRRVDLVFEGTHHRGLDDARNLARLLPWCRGEAPFPPEPPRWVRRQQRRAATRSA